MSTSIERPFRLDHLDHVVLRVHSLETSVAFYEMLGGESGGPRPAGTAMRITPSQTIILQERPEYKPAEVSAIDHINLAVKGTNIQDVTTYLRANGAELVREANGGDTIRVLDPDRNVIEIRILREG